ncbi:MAG: hypothetical protein Q9214_006627 [Letrouitia sp. 1 TL-2023]
MGGEESAGQPPVVLRSTSSDIADHSQSNSFTYSVHSQDSVTDKLSSDIECQPLAKQRRRRTSPQDQALLEAEYLKNSKPDKAARKSIVDRVALGDKEVQIWFQNRRQVARRRSRPLLPHEIFPHLQSSQESTEDATSSTFSISGSIHEPLPSSQSTPPSTQEYGDDLTTGQIGDQIVLLDKRPEEADEMPLKQPQLGRPTISAQRPLGPEAFLGLSKPNPLEEPVVRVQRKSGKRATSFALYDEEQRVPNQPSTAPGLKRTTSLVRLSTTLDGEARIKTGNESSPSPPRPHLEPSIRKPCARSGLQRSRSAIEPSEVHRLMTAGRSRDARTWTFYCDTDARDELTKQAEREQSGSAAGAIGLIRSHSNKALTPNPNKRNAHAAKQEGMKRLKYDGKRVKTADVSSSSASSSTAIKNSSRKSDGARKPKSKPPSKSTALHQDPECGGDSDKENWEPGTQTAPPSRRHRVPGSSNNNNNKSSAAPRRPVLGESVHAPSQALSFDPFLDRGLNPKAWTGNRIRKQHGAAQQQRENAKIDLEVAEFMAGEAEREEDGGKEDMDCVQGLLSLSQGAWH